MMNTQQKVIFTWIGGIIGLTLLGSFFGAISLEQKGNQKESPFVWSLSGIENISGSLYVSPGSFDQIFGLYSQAKNTLSIQTYEFTEKRFKVLFKELLKNDVGIRLIMENKKYQQFRDSFKDIQSYFSGYKNFFLQSDDGLATTYLHSKIALIDSGFLIQTANLTHSSFFSNREYFFYSTHSGVYHSLATIFEKDWKKIPISHTDIHPNLLVCPLNCRIVLESLISGAKHSIVIQNQYIEDERLVGLLGEKLLILGTGNLIIQLPETETNMRFQQQFSKKVVTLIKKPYIHAKMMLIDDQILYLGSINFSSTSMDENREIGILIDDPLIIRQFHDIVGY